MYWQRQPLLRLQMWSLERDSPATQLIKIHHSGLACGVEAKMDMRIAGEKVMDMELVMTATEDVFC